MRADTLTASNVQTIERTRNADASPPPQRGIFLIELVVTLALVAALVGLGAPSLTLLLRDYQVRTAAQDLLAELGWARIEAMRRGTRVYLRIRPPAACPAPQACGWDVFAGPNDDAAPSDSGVKLRRYDLPANVSIPEVHQRNIYVDALGVVWPRSNHIQVARSDAGEGDPSTRILCLAFGGRIRIAQGTVCLP